MTKPIQARTLCDTLDEIVSARLGDRVELPSREDAGNPESASLTKLAELKALSPDTRFVREVVGVFMDDATSLLQQMESAEERGDIQATKRLAHSFKGSVASIGAQRLYDIVSELGHASVAGSVERRAHLLESLHAELDKVEEELMRFLDGPDIGVSH